MRLAVGLALGLALSGAACSSSVFVPSDAGPAPPDGGYISCRLVEFFDGGTGTLCFEVPANGGQSLQQTCTQNAPPADAGNLTFNAGTCSRADSLGGCSSFIDGLIQNTWYYGSGGDSGTSVFGQTAADIKTLCSDMGATYLSP